MRIYFENKSEKALIINLNGQQRLLYPATGHWFILEGSRASLNMTTEDNYSFEGLSAKAGYYRGHRFITRVQYDFEIQDEMHTELYVEGKKGDHSDSYQRVIPYCKSFEFPEPIYSLKNDDEIRQKLEHNKAFEHKVEKRATLIGRLDNINEIISTVLVSILGIGLAVALFVGLWQFFSLKAAIITFTVLGFIGFLIYRLIRKLIKGVGKTADKILSSKTFDKAVDKASEKFEESFVYCKDMPEGIYKDENSYFDSKYIAAVFRYSTRLEQ